MSRSDLAKGGGLVVVAGLALAGLVLLQRGMPPTEPADILLIIVDTIRADHLGLYGYDRPTSPHLDRFAAQATVFERAYTHAPWTAPSIASILTSLTPRDHGITSWRQPLPAQSLTLAEHLQGIGYRTEAIISHQILRKKYNFNQGFDVYNTEVLAEGRPHAVSTADRITDLALARLAAPRDQPLFLWLHYFDPHYEYIVHPDFPFGKEERIDRYDSELAWTDHHLGRLLEGAAELGFTENAVIAIIGDHGEEFQDHGSWQHSNQLYEEVMRVPLIIAAPWLRAGRVDAVVPEIDLAPTLLSLAQVPAPEAFTGQAMPVHRRRLAPIDRPVLMETFRYADKRALVDGDWKFIRDLKANTQELYNLNEDPSEVTNLIESATEERERLQAQLDAYYAEGRRLAGETELSEQETERLRALGYIE